MPYDRNEIKDFLYEAEQDRLGSCIELGVKLALGIFALKVYESYSISMTNTSDLDLFFFASGVTSGLAAMIPYYGNVIVNAVDRVKESTSRVEECKKQLRLSELGY